MEPALYFLRVIAASNSGETLMKMKLLAAASVLAMTATAAVAAPSMYINVGSNAYEWVGLTANDSNTTTGTFTQFGFTLLSATSVYQLNGSGALTGNFYDTNLASDFTNLGIGAAGRSGTAMDGISTVSLENPHFDPTPARVNIDALSPLVPPSLPGTDSEGFGLKWQLEVRYKFDGVLSASGPTYTGGTWELYFNDFVNDANDRTVVSGHLVNSVLQAANLTLNLEVDSAEAGFLMIKDVNGNFVSAGDGTTFSLDANVDPPIPTDSQLLAFVDGAGNSVAVRQTELDGSIRPTTVPEPASLALVGLGFAGLFAARRRKA